MRIAVSACLVGENVTYRGDSNKNEKIIEILRDHEQVLVCPEVMGGLSIPRKPSEIKSFLPLKVENSIGEDVTKEFYRGALKAVKILKEKHVKMAILKKNSPSCGNETVYDGTFSHTIIEGSGVFVSLLKAEGIEVFNENQIDKINKYIGKEEEKWDMY
ncbi:MAG: DUF523 domain-containing protein [Bacilli bacterium]|nr:DUF523 domain-containing protein [Bacilli bacterium]